MNPKTQFVSNLIRNYSKFTWERKSSVSEVVADIAGGYHIRIYYAPDWKRGEYIIVATTSSNLVGKTIHEEDLDGTAEITIENLHTLIWDFITAEKENKFWNDLNNSLNNNYHLD